MGKLNVGDTVLLLAEKLEGYNTKVYDMEGDDIWFFGHMPDGFMPGEVVRAFVTCPDAVQHFDARFVRNAVKDNVQVSRFCWDHEIVRQQRRNAYRLQIPFQLELIVQGPDEERHTHMAKGKNISETGLAFTCKTVRLFVGDTVTCAFQLGEDAYSLFARVVRVTETAENCEGRIYGCQFENIRNLDARKLCKYIYKQQLRLGKK